MTSHQWGRVDDDGTVYVKTADGALRGPVPEGGPEGGAAAFFTEPLRRPRLRGGTARAADQVRRDVAGRGRVLRATVRSQVVDTHTRWATSPPRGAPRRSPRDSQRRPAGRARAAVGEARTAGEQIVTEAERLAEGTDWRNRANRMRGFLDEWKALPASTGPPTTRFLAALLDRPDRLHAAPQVRFAEQHEKRDQARASKERLATEAEDLATSTDWGPRRTRYRELMRQWRPPGWRRATSTTPCGSGSRAAGTSSWRRDAPPPASRTRSSPPTPWSRRRLAFEAEALLPVEDIEAAKKAFRDIADRWDAAGEGAARPDAELEGQLRRSSRRSVGSRTSSGVARTRRVRSRRRHGVR